jgi:hypothetical protein
MPGLNTVEAGRENFDGPKEVIDLSPDFLHRMSADNGLRALT